MAVPTQDKSLVKRFRLIILTYAFDYGMGALRVLRIRYTSRDRVSLRKRTACEMAGHQGMPESQSLGASDSS